jgi:endonuclease YncB( thermonuclease family)
MSRRTRRLLLPFLALLAAAAAAWLGELLPGGGPDMAGPAAVVDGDTIRLGGRTIRLDGIDAPEARQTCRRDGRPWPCGAEATDALRRVLHVHGAEARCTTTGRDRYDRTLARCRVDGRDLGALQVREGWAVAYRRYSSRYVPEEWLAWAGGRGIWAGEFEMPGDWRREN